METGIAIGGPRDGIKLSAELTWDGRIEKHSGFNGGVVKKYYSGRYKWSAAVPGWCWQPDSTSSTVGKTPRLGGYDKKP